MGLHRDSDERAPDPVVSFSTGAACVFRFGNTENRRRPWTDVELRSGDLVVFGDESRLAYHGVPKLLPAVEVPDTGLATGRMNIRLRVSGLGWLQGVSGASGYPGIGASRKAGTIEDSSGRCVTPMCVVPGSTAICDFGSPTMSPFTAPPSNRKNSAT
jgi:hypothetical protein